MKKLFVFLVMIAICCLAVYFIFRDREVLDVATPVVNVTGFESIEPLLVEPVIQSSVFTDDEIAVITADTPMKPGALANPKVREAFGAVYEQRDAEEKTKVAAYARSNNIPIRGEDAEGFYLLRWDRANNTAFKIRPLNDEAAIVSRAARVRGDSINGAGAIYGLTGGGYRAYIFEAGSPASNHVAFYVTPGDPNSGTRIFNQIDPSFDDHAAHVTGTVGAGFGANNGNACGMAPECELANRRIHDYTYATMNGANSSIPGTGGIVANNSYGDTGSQGSYYGTTSWSYDNTTYGLRYWLLFSAAGNGNNSANFDKLYNVSKNGMNVAACDDAVTDRLFDMRKIKRKDSSGMGPCDDGRIKPDITANGTTLSSVGTGTNGWRSLSGTSMSSPSAAGSAMLIQELHGDLNSGHIMIASLLRGLICHTATDIPRLTNDRSGSVGQPGPDFTFGWGLFDALTACDKVKAASDDPGNLHLTETTLTNGTQNSFPFVWDGSSPIRATIAWSDPPGFSTEDGDTTPQLVNDLDLRLVSPSGTTNEPYMWDRSDPLYPDVPAIPGDNDRDNIEQVYLPNPAVTGIWTLVVSHKGTLTDGLQEYGLILDGQQWNQKEISVLGNQTVIRDEDPFADYHDDTRFTPVAYNISGGATHTFTIANVGNVPLTLGAEPVVLGGTDTGVFSVTQPASTVVAAGTSTTFEVTYAPTTAGEHAATLTITNDDADEGPYNFVLSGESFLLGIETDVSELTVPEGSTNTFGVRLDGLPTSSVTVTVARVSGDEDISVTGGETLVFNSTTWSNWQAVTLSAAQDEFWYESTSTVRCTSANMTDVDVVAVEVDDDPNPTEYLPFVEPFENEGSNAVTLGPLAEQHGWAGDGIVQTGTVHAGTQALALTNGTASHTFAGDASNIWVTLWAQPTLSEGPPEDIPTNASAVFYVATNNLLMAYNSTNAVEIEGATVSNGWNKIEVSCDFISKVWNLSLNNVPRVGSFDFYGAPASFQALEIKAGTNTLFIDSITVSDTSDGADTDGDGLPDDWEDEHYGGATNAVSTNLCANGVNTVLEAYIAGLNPTNASSLFLISDFSPQSSVLSWNSVSGRVYSVYWTSNLLSSFQPLETNLPWTEMPYTDTNESATGQGFYKIEVELE